VDLDLDGREELEIYNKHMNVFLSPHQGGQIMELDLLDFGMNAQASLARRPEPYHDGSCRYDGHLRSSLIDHFLPVDATVEQFDENPSAERGDFVARPFALKTSKESQRIAAILSARGRVGAQDVSLEKTLLLGRDATGLEVTVTIRNLSRSVLSGRYGLEFNLALLTPFMPESFVHDGTFEPAGGLQQRAAYRKIKSLGVCDRVRGLSVEFAPHQEAEFFVVPVQTLTPSDAGLEPTLQSVCVMPVWMLRLEPNEAAQFTVLERFEPLTRTPARA
jgi:alpha-amylase